MDIANKNPGAGRRRGFQFCTVDGVRERFYLLPIISQRLIGSALLVIGAQATCRGCCNAVGSPRRLP